MDDAVCAYVNGIPRDYRPLFDRLHRLVLDGYPDAAVVLSYGMPTYKVGRRRLFVGVWKHGVSLYGWAGEPELLHRYPDLKYGRSTIRLRPADADRITDAEFRELIGGALAQ